APELLLEPVGDPEHSPEASDVLREDEGVGVVGEQVAKGLIDGLLHGGFGGGHVGGVGAFDQLGHSSTSSCQVWRCRVSSSVVSRNTCVNSSVPSGSGALATPSRIRSASLRAFASISSRSYSSACHVVRRGARVRTWGCFRIRRMVSASSWLWLGWFGV